MQFLIYRNDGTLSTCTNDISDILAAAQPEDIIDTLDGIGVKVNRFFESIDNSVNYIIWLDQITNAVTMDMSNEEGYYEPVQEFKISESEIQTLIKFCTQTAERIYTNMTNKVTKTIREDFKECEKLANKIMKEFDIEIPFLTWALMTYEELLELEKELRSK